MLSSFRSPLLSLGISLTLFACGEPSSSTDAGDAATEASTDAIADAPVADEMPTGRSVTFTPVPRGRAVEAGIRREAFFVTAPAPPRNPTTMVETPAALNRVQVLRYRIDADPPRPAKAVVVAMPGFLGGGGSFDGLARAVVRASAMGDGAVEFWAVDRRANQLEDLRGMEAAEAMRDPELVRGYYLDRDLTLNGERFTGFLTTRDRNNSYLSEWGLATTINDLRAVVQSIPSSRERVVLLGHSLGASIVEGYAAWDFDGTAGYRSIAGLILVDGVLAGARTSENNYYLGGPGGVLGTVVGVTPLRANGPFFFELPLLGVRALAIAELVARRALANPEAVVQDRHRDSLLRTLLGLDTVPPMTNAAAMGFGFDTASCALTIASMNIGSPTGGPIGMAPSVLGNGMIMVPSSPTSTYRWIDATASTPREYTPFAVAAAGWSSTPSNFAEWYFPYRISVDVGLLGDLRVPEDSFAWREGIRAKHGGAVDVPVLGIGAGLVPRATAYDVVPPRLAPMVGMDLPAAGATRTDQRGFRAVAYPEMSHIDPIVAPEGTTPNNPIPGLVRDFARNNTRGEAVIPVR